ncbi:hypothetical protein D9M71_699410 [compost metagenome]
MLDDRRHLTLGITDDAAIAGRIIQGHGQQAKLLRGDLGKQTLERVYLDQWYIAVEDQHGIGIQCR